MRIALDIGGGDYGLAPHIEGSIQVAAKAKIDLLLVGPANKIRAELLAQGIAEGDPRFEIFDAQQDSTMSAAKLVGEGRAAGFVSVGNPHAVMSAALFYLKRLPGVLRPALACSIATPKGNTLLLDAGTNVDCKPWHLVQFAQMGVVFSRRVYGIIDPSVGLLSISPEHGPNNELINQVYALIGSAGVNFSGHVEAQGVAEGQADVIVCDGFSGNILLKTMEGATNVIREKLQLELITPWRYRLPMVFLRKPVSRFNDTLLCVEHDSSAVIGVNGVAVVSRNGVHPNSIADAIHYAEKIAEAELPQALQEGVARTSEPKERMQV